MNQIVKDFKKKIQNFFQEKKKKLQRLLFYNWRVGTHTCCNANLSKLLVC